MSSERRGWFTLPERMVRKEGLQLLPLFERVVIHQCWLDFSTGRFVYTGLSPDFDEIEEGFR
jgi:hypothetical protein